MFTSDQLLPRCRVTRGEYILIRGIGQTESPSLTHFLFVLYEIPVVEYAQSLLLLVVETLLLL